MTKRKQLTLGQMNSAILAGDENLSVWSDEELLRGKRKGRNGKWNGPPPKVVPLAVHEELNRRRMSRAREVLDESLEAAVSLFAEVVNDAEAPMDLRLKAAKEIMDRVMGKAPDKVSIRLAPEPWEEAVASVEFVTDVIDTTVASGFYDD